MTTSNNGKIILSIQAKDRFNKNKVCKNLLKTLLVTIVFASCSQGNSTTSNTSDSTQQMIAESESSGIPTIESAQLFQDLKGDIVAMNETYLNKRIRIKNLLVCGGYSQDGTTRIIACVPLDLEHNKMGYLFKELYVDQQLDNLKTEDAIGFWTVADENKGGSLYGRSVFYLGNTKLDKLYDNKKTTNITGYEIALRSASDYKSLTLPTLIRIANHDIEYKPHWIASFTQVVDIEADVKKMGGGANGAYVSLTDAVIVNKKDFPITDVANIINTHKAEIDKAKGANEQLAQNMNIVSVWSGMIDGKKIVLNIKTNSDFGISGDLSIAGESTAVYGRYSDKDGEDKNKTIIDFDMDNHRNKLNYGGFEFTLDFINKPNEVQISLSEFEDPNDDTEKPHKIVILKRN